METGRPVAVHRVDSVRADPSKVLSSGDGLKFGYINQPIYVTIDTRPAGSGELAVHCEGQAKKAMCELRDHQDGTFTLTIKAKDLGQHKLHIKYDGIHVPGSPFLLRVSPASLVTLNGPGLEDGILGRDKAEFIVDTAAAGKGDIKIRIGGPRGNFKLKTQKVGKSVICNFNPKWPGLYIINVTWEEDPLPGSPYAVFYARNMDELDRYLALQSQA